MTQFEAVIAPLLRDATGFLSGVYDTVRDYWGTQRRTCPICGQSGLFRSHGRPYRIDARCRVCGALERHRLLALVAAQRNLFAGKDILHFAPERAVTRLIAAHAPASYAVSDFGDASTLNLDIEHMEQGNGCWDVVVVSHVLEHVDDRKALGELRRVLRPNGTLVVMVPIIEGWATTYEDPTITRPADRHLHLGQWDHVRYYGADFRSRLLDAGFRFEEHTAEEPDVRIFGLTRGAKVFLSTPA